MPRLALPAIRVSFDIDDTLVCGAEVPSEQLVPFLYRRRYPEPLRKGTRELLRSLSAHGCRVWLYTSSSRPAAYLSGWFACLGIPLDGVVNLGRHTAVVGCRGPSKYPPAFGIGLHVDDSEGVAMEAQTHRFQVLIVSPQDPDWAGRVLDAVDRLRLRSAPRLQ